MRSGDGCAGPLPQTGGGQVIEHVFEDTHPLERLEAKRKEWNRHRDVGQPEQEAVDNSKSVRQGGNITAY